MEQYSNLNVHGKIKQKNGVNGAGEQGTESNDVVLYPTLTGAISDVTTAIAGKADKDLENIEVAGTRADGKTIVWDDTNQQWEYGEAGKVDAVQVNGTAIAGEGAQTKVANIVTGTGLTSDGGTINHSNSVTAETSGKGSATAIPIIKYDAQGHITSVTTATVYPPTSVGTSGYFWKSDGSGAGQWSQLAGTAPITVTRTSATVTTLSHDDSGVTAGTYKSVTVNSKGHVTAGTNPTTLAGYGITDAAPLSHVTVEATNAILGHVKVVYGDDDQTYTVPTETKMEQFVNSSIASSTANFLGTYKAAGTGTNDLGIAQATVDNFTYVPDATMISVVASALATKLQDLGKTVSNLDYAYIAVNKSTTTIPVDIDWFWRFKASVSGSTVTWTYEFTLNNSSYTAEQWAAINSGITSGLVGNYNTHLADTKIHVPSSTTAGNVLISTNNSAPQWKSISGSGYSTDGSGNIVITNTTYSGGTKITLSSTAFNHDPTTRTNSTSTASPSYGGNFTVVDSITSDATGHITGVNTKTVTLPASDNTDYRACTNNVTGTKLYLVGGSSQTGNTTTGTGTRSNSGCYIGTDNEIYSKSNYVWTDGHSPFAYTTVTVTEVD